MTQPDEQHLQHLQQAVSLHNAYRFETSGEPRIEGTVYKVRPRHRIWEATVDGTAIKVRAETRGEAVEEALRQARSLGSG